MPLCLGWPGSQLGHRHVMQGARDRPVETALPDSGKARLHVDRGARNPRGSGRGRGDDLVRMLGAVIRVLVFAAGLGMVVPGVVARSLTPLVAPPHRVLTRDVRENDPRSGLAGKQGEQEDGRSE